jgi:phage repressor protein C with HTH and peptisase S24 domain
MAKIISQQAKRLKELRLDKKLSRAQLAGLAGTSLGQIQKLEEGDRKLTVEWMERLATPLGAQLSDFIPTAGALMTTNKVVEFEGSEFAILPVHDIRFAAGPGAENHDETPLDHYVVSLQLLRAMTTASLENIRFFEVRGDSMESTLFDRDWIGVDISNKRLSNPGIFALIYEGDAIIKRASQHFETKAVTLTSDNPKYKPMTIRHPEDLAVAGRMFLSIRRF